jgi:hypothetical protein
MEPLSLTHRRITFFLLVTLFVVALPFLFLYATGYRFSFSNISGFTPTGGIYVAAERSGAEIYIDGELVRETRAFRKAFYAQGLTPGTHRVYVQKEGHHTWVKELPVYPYLVTEAQAFNLPVVPTVRVISPWRTAAGATVLTAPLSVVASTTNEVVVSTSTAAARSFVADTEYATLLQLFASSATSSESVKGNIADAVRSFTDATLGAATNTSTTTKEQSGVRLFTAGGDVFAEWVGPRDGMPYYYCAQTFELAGATPESEPFYKELEAKNRSTEPPLVGPVQSVPENAACDPTISLDRKGEAVTSFDFFPGSTDLVIVARESGVYATEIDNRAWQNVQPLLEGAHLDFRVVNGTIYVYDGKLIYQVLLGT